MAFTSMLVTLPPDNTPVLISTSIYPGEVVEALFDSANQLFTTTTSGLIIYAFSVIEWELI